MRNLLLLFLAIIAFFSASAQYTLINHFSGPMAYGSRTITVTPSGGADTYWDPCIPPPAPHFWCGSSYTSGMYSFTSSAPVYAIKLEMEGLNGGPLGGGEYMQVYIDGLPYTLTPADVVSFSSCGSPGAPPCYLFGGKFYGPLTGSLSGSVHNAGNLDVRLCHGFTSFAIYCNGIGNGVAYHISFDSTAPTSVLTATATSPICEGDSIALSVGPYSSGMTFAWTGPSGFSSTLQNPKRYATGTAAGTYTVVTTVGDCAYTNFVNVVVKPKPNVTASGTTPVCIGGTINLFASPFTTGETFSWSGPTGFSSGLQNPSIGSATFANAGTYTVIANLGGCLDTATVSIVVNAGPTITALSNGPVCEGDTIKFTAGPAVPGQTFVWSGPGGFTSTAQNPFKTPSAVSDAGTYTVITTVGACTATATVSVAIKPKPNVYASGTAVVCVGDAISLSASPVLTGETFSWTGPAGFSSTLPAPTRPSAIFAYSGVYQVIASLAGCMDTALMFVSVNTTPSVTATSNSPVCEGDTIKFTSGPAIPGQTFAWSGPASFSGIIQNPFRSPASAAHMGSYRVITAIGGCRDTAFVNVVVNNKPTLALAATMPLCIGKTLSLTASPFTTGETFTWTGPGGFTSTLQNPTIPGVSISNAGVYTATATLSGCTSKATVSVVVNDLINVTANASSPLCAGDILVLKATSSVPGLFFQWIGPGTFTSNDSDPVVANVTAANSGTYMVVAGADGCNDTATVTVVVNPLPIATAIADPVLCEGQLLHLYATPAAPGRVFLWSGPAYFTATTQNVTIPSAGTWATGDYIVRVVENGCASADTVSVRVVSVGNYGSADTTICTDKPVSIQLNSGAPDNTNVMWSNGSGGNLLEVTRPGTYWVQVSSTGCIRVDTITVKGQSCICDAKMPDAFTPNGDDLNDMYWPIITPDCQIFDFKFAIYNRWGQQVFLSDHPKKKWDGLFQGVKAELGVYMYYLSYSAGPERTKYTMKGDVTLVR